MVRLLGLDPGLRFTGWGVIDVDGNRLCHVGDGVIATDNTDSVPERLKILHDALMAHNGIYARLVEHQLIADRAMN